MPNKDLRVCNLHFVDGKATAENPEPTLQLGHNKKTRPLVAHSIRMKELQQTTSWFIL